MNKILRLCIIYALILSPIWVNVIANHFVLTMSQSDPVMMLIESVGVAIIGVVGVIFSALVRKKPKADTVSLLGYAVPAVLVCIYIATRRY